MAFYNRNRKFADGLILQYFMTIIKLFKRTISESLYFCRVMILSLMIINDWKVRRNFNISWFI